MEITKIFKIFIALCAAALIALAVLRHFNIPIAEILAIKNPNATPSQLAQSNQNTASYTVPADLFAPPPEARPQTGALISVADMAQLPGHETSDTIAAAAAQTQSDAAQYQDIQQRKPAQYRNGPYGGRLFGHQVDGDFGKV